MYMTLLEKMSAVDRDFKKSGLYMLGDVPRDPDEMKAYFKEALKQGNAFIDRYSSVKGSPIWKYVSALVEDYMAGLERVARKYQSKEANF